MCGVAGFLSFKAPVDGARLRRMLDAIRHRGPDGEGTFLARRDGRGLHATLDGPVHAALGHVRLAIVDLSPDGAEPMSNEDGSLWLTFNGEIYNHLELRAELQAQGHVFRSHCDAEVLLHGFEQHGTAFFGKLRGMYAFALLDLKADTLVLCRDPFGIKPLFHAGKDGVVAFASELTSLERAGFTGALSVSAVALYAALGFVPAPLTLREGASKLLPGAVLRADVHGVRLDSVSQPPLPPQHRATFSSVNPVAATHAALTETVRAHLMADVEVGAFLSGGIDSALITAAMVDAHQGPVQAFTMAVDDPAMDESGLARHAADTLGVRHHIRRVSSEEARARLPSLLAEMDEPLADASLLPTRLVSELAREHVKVVLSGDGGDELFGGYTRHELLMLLDPFRPLGRVSRLLARGVVAAGEERINSLYSGLQPRLHLPSLHAPARKLVAALETLGQERAVAYGRMFRTGFPDELATLGISGDPAIAHLVSCGDGFAAADALSLAQAVDARTWLPHDILPKVDRMSMAVGLEARVPLIDVRMAQHAASLDAPSLRKGREGKRVLRILAEQRFGKALAHAGKRGFGLPMRAWLAGPLKPWRTDALGSLASRNLFSPAGLAQLQDSHDGGTDHSPLLFALCALEMWLRADSGRTL
jgi:asparagine synthase (glutamine-hydrolysing)